MNKPTSEQVRAAAERQRKSRNLAAIKAVAAASKK